MDEQKHVKGNLDWLRAKSLGIQKSVKRNLDWWLVTLFTVITVIVLLISRKDYELTLTWSLSFILASLGIFVANKRAMALDKTAEAQAKAVAATETGNRQQRFRDAVTHLGHKKASVRQGGAHTLFQMALENAEEENAEKKALRVSIAEILCSHIREVTGDEKYQQDHKQKPSTEIQSLLQMLFTTRIHGEEELDRFWEGIQPDLSGGYFCGLEIEKARFRNARLADAQFQRASLVMAQFQGADLYWVQFHGAILIDAQFQGANLRSARFLGVNLCRTQFQGADLEEAQFHRAILRQAKFQAANLKEAQFQGAELQEAQFQATYLEGAAFQEAKFDKTQFQGVSSGENGPTRRESFEDRIRKRQDKSSCYAQVVFSGGFDEESKKHFVDRLERAGPGPLWKEQEIHRFKERVFQHGEMEANHEPPDGVVSGTYDQTQADAWIRDYANSLLQKSINPLGNG